MNKSELIEFAKANVEPEMADGIEKAVNGDISYIPCITRRHNLRNLVCLELAIQMAEKAKGSDEEEYYNDEVARLEKYVVEYPTV